MASAQGRIPNKKGKGRVVDLTKDALDLTKGEDKLTKLPSELLHLIFDYLFATHSPDRAFNILNGREAFHPKPCSHDLDRVAATCQILRSETTNWARHFLVQHKDATKFKEAEDKLKKNGTRGKLPHNKLRGQRGLLTWASKHCVFCGKNTNRTCILMNGFHCCIACDKTYWPDKITKTQAKEEFNLKDETLLPHQHLGTKTLQAIAHKFPDGFPRIRYGTYMACGVPTTMFLRKDVKWLASQHHGDLEAHLSKREGLRAARRRKLDENKQKAEEKKKQEEAVAAAAQSQQQAPRNDDMVYYIADDDEYEY